MLSQLQFPIPITTPKGKAWAVAIIDYGPHWDLQWVTFIKETGECWTFRNSEIRQEQNYTFGLPKPTPIHDAVTRSKHELASTRPANGKANGNGHYHPASFSPS